MKLTENQVAQRKALHGVPKQEKQEMKLGIYVVDRGYVSAGRRYTKSRNVAVRFSSLSAVLTFWKTSNEAHEAHPDPNLEMLVVVIEGIVYAEGM